MFVPPLSQDYVSLNESFVSNNYGVSINRADGNRSDLVRPPRQRQADPVLPPGADQAHTGEKTKEKGPIFRDSLPLEGPEKIAAEALLAPIRQHSADVETFVSEAIKRANNGNDDNVKLLMAGDTSLEKKAHIVETLLSIAHVPMERVHTIRLVADLQQSPELWLRSFNGENWLYFNVVTGEQGLPSDRLIWWLGDEPLMTIDGGKKAQVSFSLNSSEMNAIRLAAVRREHRGGLPRVLPVRPAAVHPADLPDHDHDSDRRAGDPDPAQPDRPADPRHLHPGADRPGLPRDRPAMGYRPVHRDHRPGPVAALLSRAPEAADAAAPLGGADLRGGDDRGDQPVQPQARLRERPVDRPVPDGDPDHDHRTPVDHLGRAAAAMR